MKSNLKRTGFIFSCVAPAVILFAIFMLVPTFNVFRLSLYQRSTFNPNEVFIGLKNFQMLMKDATFIRSMQNMLLLIVMVTVFTMATALVFAGILTREKLKGRTSSGSCSTFPTFCPSSLFPAFSLPSMTSTEACSTAF